MMRSNWSRATEPDDLDLAPDPQREDERLREERWGSFVREVRGMASDHGWTVVFTELSCAYHSRFNPESYGPGRLSWHMQEFSDAEGWPAVLSALSRAMAEQEAEAQEVERRR